MDLEKIGNFIAENRKAKKLTQEELAEKLGITKNAVSKWERGLSFPDVSLYQKICNELDIQIEELLNGEKNKIEKTNNLYPKKKYFIRFLCICFVIFLLLFLSFMITSKLLKIHFVTNKDDLYHEVLEYLKKEEFETNPDSIYKDFNVFQSYHGFGIEKKKNTYYVYMWIYSQSNFLEESDTLAISKIFSLPCRATFKENELVSIEYPKGKKVSKASIQKLFPKILNFQIIHFDKEDELYEEVLKKENIYYNYLKLDMKNLTLEDIRYEDLILSISVQNTDCVPIQLNIYDKFRYVLYTSYQACRPNEFCNAMLHYTEKIEGTYEYDILEIVKHSVDENNLAFTLNDKPIYKLFSGNGHSFITDSNNKYLMDFLNQIHVDLNQCAKKDYKN